MRLSHAPAHGGQKHRWIAHLLNILAPGVGLSYWERSARATRVIAGAEIALMGALALWLSAPFHLWTLLGLLAAAWLPLQMWLASEVSRGAAAEQGWARRPEGLWPYVALVALCATPPLLTAELCRSRLFSLTRVWDSSMFPQLLEGDVLFVDRRAFVERPPSPGELVVVECPSVGPVVSRALARSSRPALARREASGEVRVADVPYPRLPARPSFANATDEERLALLERRWWFERAPSSPAPYLTALPRLPSAPPQLVEVSLEEGDLFILPDVRDVSAPYMRCAGRMSATRLIGKPLFVHEHESPTPRPSRRGLAAR